MILKPMIREILDPFTKKKRKRKKKERQKCHSDPNSSSFPRNIKKRLWLLNGRARIRTFSYCQLRSKLLINTQLIHIHACGDGITVYSCVSANNMFEMTRKQDDNYVPQQ